MIGVHYYSKVQLFTHVDDYIQCLNIVHDITDDADTQNDITPNFV